MENNQQGQYYYPSAPLPNEYNIPVCNPATVNNSRDIFINGNKMDVVLGANQDALVDLFRKFQGHLAF